MKNKIQVIVLVIVVIAVMVGFLTYRLQIPSFSSTTTTKEAVVYYCPMHPTYTSDRPGTCPICNMNLVLKEQAKLADLAHNDSGNVSPEGAKTEQPKEFTVQEIVNMKPGEICLLHKCKMGMCMVAMTEEFARLGKCPHCGEDLGVVIKDALPSGYAEVKLGSEKQKLIGVRTSPVKRTKMTKTIRTAGRIAYDPELYQSQEELIQALHALSKARTGSILEITEQASKLVESAKMKLKLLGLSSELISEIESAGKADKSLLYSEPGGKVWLYAPIYEYEIPLIKTGQKIQAKVPAIQERSFEGIIRSIDSVLDPVTRSVRIRAQLDNTDGLLKPEMYANVLIASDLGEVLTVPEEAVFATGEKHITFVSKSDGEFEPREVQAGAKSESEYEIKSGLSEGELVITSGNFLIDSESRLKSALEGIGDGGNAHAH